MHRFLGPLAAIQGRRKRQMVVVGGGGTGFKGHFSECNGEEGGGGDKCNHKKCNLNNIFHEGEGHFATGERALCHRRDDTFCVFWKLGGLAPLFLSPCSDLNCTQELLTNPQSRAVTCGDSALWNKLDLQIRKALNVTILEGQLKNSYAFKLAYSQIISLLLF